MAGDFSMFCIDVINGVISKVRDDFMKYGATGEAVLTRVQCSWEMNLIQCGAIHPNLESRPPTPSQTPIRTPLPDYAPSPLSDVRNGVDVQSGRTNPYMPPSSMNIRPLGVDVNVDYVEGREDANREGPNHPPTQDFFTMLSEKRKLDEYPIIEFEASNDQILRSKRSSSSSYSSSSVIPQRDGINDQYNNYSNGGDEEELNDDDDDDAYDDDDCEDLVLCQFDKVTRTKNRWKCNLKNGIMHLNGKDILFNKAMGNFEF